MSKIDHILLKSLENPALIKKRVEEYFSDEKIEAIIKNVLDGQINRYIAQKTNEIAIDRIYEIIKEQLDKVIHSEDTIAIIKHECKKFVYDYDFLNQIKVYFDGQLNAYCGQYVEEYILFNLAEKFLKDIKQAHKDELELQQ